MLQLINLQVCWFSRNAAVDLSLFCCEAHPAALSLGVPDTAKGTTGASAEHGPLMSSIRLRPAATHSGATHPNSRPLILLKLTSFSSFICAVSQIPIRRMTQFRGDTVPSVSANGEDPSFASSFLGPKPSQLPPLSTTGNTVIGNDDANILIGNVVTNIQGPIERFELHSHTNGDRQAAFATTEG